MEHIPYEITEDMVYDAMVKWKSWLDKTSMKKQN